jgi:6-pyruvoyl-tetrahydropterin synthase
VTVRVELSITRRFVASHSLPEIGVADPHEHTFELDCGYAADVEPAAGCARPLQELEAEVDGVLSRIEGTDLNAVLSVPPTAEMLASWILAQLPQKWEWASITAYGGYKCRVERAAIEPLLLVLRT